jgi:hypothetical protein
VPRRGDTEAVVTHVAAPVAAVREVLRDVTRHGDWSPEVVRVRWRHPVRRTPAGRLTGARFDGWSRTGPVLWVRTCEVVADDARTFAWVTLPTWWNHDATLWRIDLASAPHGGTTLTLSYEVLAEAPWFIRAGGAVTGRVRRLPTNLQATVDAIGREVAGQSGRGSRPRSSRSSAVRSRASS